MGQIYQDYKAGHIFSVRLYHAIITFNVINDPLYISLVNLKS